MSAEFEHAEDLWSRGDRVPYIATDPDWWVPLAGTRTLTREEEVCLARKARSGDEEALHTLIERNLKMVVHVARRWLGNGIDFDDLVQEGCIGLTNAARNFDPARGYRFSTYALWHILHAVQDCIYKGGRLVRTPVRCGQDLHRLARTRIDLTQSLMHPPTPAELAEAMGLAEEQVNHLLILERGILSLDEPCGERGENTLEEVIADDPVDFERGIERAELAAEWGHRIKRLPLRQRQAVRLRYGFCDGIECTHGEIGKALGCTRQSVQHQLRGAHANLIRQAQLAAAS